MANFTRKAIMESLIKLLNEKTLDKITVKDIVEDCGINRNTFYYHFQDIHELVIELLNRETENVLLKNIMENSWEDSFITAAKFALENKKAIYHIYNSVSREDLERYLNTIAKDVMSRFITKNADSLEIDEIDKDLIVNFYKSALVGMVMDWISSGMKGDPEQLIHRLGYLHEGSIIYSLKRAAK